MTSTRSVGFPQPAAIGPVLRRRRSLLAAGAGLAAPSLPRFARAAEVAWHLGHHAPTDFALHKRLLEAAAEIATRSSGRMTLEISPNGERGGPVGLFAQLREGTIDVVPVACQLLSSNFSLGSLPMVGFAFPDYDALWTALDGGLGVYTGAQMKERLGLVPMRRAWDFGFRQVTTSGKVVKAAGDIVGLRLRTPPEADFIGLLQALKVLPVAIPLGGLETALKSRAIDGQEGVLPLVKAAKLYEAQSSCALTNHVWDGHWMCISGKSWSSLPQALKDVVATSFDEAALRQRQDVVESEAQIRIDLETAGMRFNTVEAQSFRDVLRKAGYYKVWQAKMGDDGWSALEKYTGRLA